MLITVTKDGEYFDIKVEYSKVHDNEIFMVYIFLCYRAL